jgi:hypothetical protein
MEKKITMVERINASGYAFKNYLLPATRKKMDCGKAKTYLKGILYDFNNPYFVNGKEHNEIERAIEQGLCDALSYVSYRSDKYKSVTFTMPDVKRALKEEPKHLDQPLTPDMQARYDAKHVSQQEAR